MIGQLLPTLSIKKVNGLVGCPEWILVIRRLVMIGLLGCSVNFGCATQIIDLPSDIVLLLGGLVDTAVPISSQTL